MKQLAVEWLIEKLNQCEPMYSGIQSNEHKEHLEKLVQQSKEIEKEQIIYAHIEGDNTYTVGGAYYDAAEQYYEQKFGGKDEQQ